MTFIHIVVEKCISERSRVSEIMLLSRRTVILRIVLHYRLVHLRDLRAFNGRRFQFDWIISKREKIVLLNRIPFKTFIVALFPVLKIEHFYLRVFKSFHGFLFVHLVLGLAMIIRYLQVMVP